MALVQMSMGELLANLQTKFGRDFSNYRLSCIQRRVALRMSTLKLATLDDYLAYLAGNPKEIEQLLDTVTIHVTEFFRDNEVFEAVAKDLVPEIVSNKLHSPSRTIRVWSAGCSTGEETYSLAVVVLRHLQSSGSDLALEVYGTDVSKEACAIAREGVYAARKIESVPGDVTRRYFEAAGTDYRVVPEVRRHVKFSVHDLFSPSPFSLLDLVVCRNVLIHFDHSVRNDVLKRFHAALGDRGLLILGKSEAVMGSALACYELVDPRNKIYRKKSSATPEGGRP
jgi:two-component system, chemotaxis family, CheB/CheR fusion protein